MLQHDYKSAVPAPVPARPVFKTVVINSTELAATDLNGMQAVLSAWQSAEYNAEQLEAVNDLNAAIIAERNSILRIAQDEERRSNSLSSELADQQNQQQQQNQQNFIENSVLKVMCLALMVIAL